ncbi:MAG: sarcosine oxidase subunit beta family protein [Alphaproteobacteria bacterium]|nr:sarcosine oxidase subunit beta family protein [Alphaproteobacteria bacterium]MDX5368721.1 sarcosine oxidase subunit beta family protein [Alphaproteobacteria bacterium]MDX5463463.1 sarcosine oxidase subunit beta family protein [Alphaproteobacteria bacterium]
MTRFSAFAIARNALSFHKDWQPHWRNPEPKRQYDAVIVGAGGHGLATAYYLAKEHGLANIAVLEKGWLGGGNTGRNTTIIRSNYLQDASNAIYELSRALYEGLSQELNYNIMFSPRGVMMLAQTEHEYRALQRTSHANRLNGVETRMITADEVKRICPILNTSPNARYPVLGALWQPRAGTARHDAVAWGYARGADARGVDIVQNCEVTGIDVENGQVTGLSTTRGHIRTRKVGVVVAGHTSQLMAMAGVRMPIESVALQALVSEPIKPVMPCVVMANTVHGYMSQSDKGELVIGGGADAYNNFNQRGSFTSLEHTVRALVETFPAISRLRMLRQWGGIVDMTGDRSPILSRTPVEGLYVNCGWGTGGFKAIPGSGFSFARLIARGEDEVCGPFSLDRFREGRMIDESVAAAVAH